MPNQQTPTKSDSVSLNPVKITNQAVDKTAILISTFLNMIPGKWKTPVGIVMLISALVCHYFVEPRLEGDAQQWAHWIDSVILIPGGATLSGIGFWHRAAKMEPK